MIEHLQTAFENSAEWRRQKAEEYPHDASRNLSAATQLGVLAKSAANVEAGRAAQYAELFGGEGDSCRAVEEEQEMIRSVGFHSFWDTADEFIDDLIARIKRVERIDEDDLVADLK